jgi:hypothetical protein
MEPYNNEEHHQQDLNLGLGDPAFDSRHGTNDWHKAIQEIKTYNY